MLAFISEAFVEEDRVCSAACRSLSIDPICRASAHVALWSDNIEQDWLRAVEAGAEIVKALEAKPWGQIAGYVRDQDGIIVELCTSSPRPMPARD